MSRQAVQKVIPRGLSTVAAPTLGPDPRPPEFSDDSLALRFASRHEHDRLYVSRWSSWLIFDGQRWNRDDTLKVFDDARSVCREAAASCNDLRAGKMLASAATVAAVERLSRADRRLAAAASQFDADQWLLSTPAGAVDLTSGLLRPSRREDYFTKMTRVAPGGSCDRWLRFLDQVTGGDEDLQSFIARIIGYSLTGSVREHAFFFCFGFGSNGKTVLTETISSILGDYAMPAPIEMFTATKFQAHSTDVAGLQGARFVTASETEAGRAFAEAKIKLLTGGETISARRMRADNVSFAPQFKLMITGNHKPSLTSNDEAMRRRLHLIPFAVTIQPWERDPKLPEKLREEWPGILQWAIDGCLEWQRVGLAPPACVREATDEYLEAEDTVREWLNSAIEMDSRAMVSSKELFGSWRSYAEAGCEDPGTLSDFAKALQAKNLVLKHTREGNRWIGIRLKGKAQ